MVKRRLPKPPVIYTDEQLGVNPMGGTVYNPNKPGKVCRRCRKYRELRDYQTPRTKECIICQVRRRETSLLGREAAAKAAMRDTATPALTSTPEGRAMLRRAHYRSRMEPKVSPVDVNPIRLCRRCQKMKKLSEFGSHWFRICLACDGPDLETIIRSFQRIR